MMKIRNFKTNAIISRYTSLNNPNFQKIAHERNGL